VGYVHAKQPEVEKPAEFIGGTLDELRSFPIKARKYIGDALREAQRGGKHRGVKSLTGNLTGILEITADDDNRTFRTVYTIKIGEIVYVPHAFCKKSKSGIATPKKEIDLILRRLKTAETHHKEPMVIAKVRRRKTTYVGGEKIVRGSGNVYADLGLPNAGDLLARAQLLDAIRAVVAQRRFTQMHVADLTGVKQPKISVLLGGDTHGFTAERLIRMLNALGQDVEIRIHPARKNEVGHTWIHASA
jgi:phage-related protein/predicted XRE-type DNA-binding protein